MPQYLRQAIEIAAEHPMGAVACAVFTLLYINLMFSGPRVY
jgi:hypothetical protein